SLIVRELSYGPNGQRTVQRRRSPLAGYIPKSNSQPPVPIGQKIVKISAQLARRNIRGREIKPRHISRTRRQELHLNFANGIKIVTQPPFPLASLFIEAGILKRDGHIRAER